MSLEQQPLIVITGASAGIGAAIARRFGRENYRLALVARRKDKLENLQREIKAPSFSYELDVSDNNAVQKIMAQIEKEHGPIHILVNNAGLALGTEAADQAKIEEWDQCVDVNVKGLLYCTRAVLPSMVNHKRGHIINMGSMAGTYPYPGGNTYGATKAFVHQFSSNLRADLLGTHVRVSCIEPGAVSGSEFSTVRFRGNEEKAKKVYEGYQPLTPEDIAETVHFCHALPPHVNINFIELMPTAQAAGPLAFYRS